MKIVFSTFILLTIACISANCQVVKTEEEAMRLICALPETRSFMKMAKKSRPSVMMAGTPGKGFKYYWVKVGLSNMEIFRTNFDFYVDPKTATIYYLDVYTESGTKAITLQQWRRWRKTSAWKHIHQYRHRNGELILQQ